MCGESENTPTSDASAGGLLLIRMVLYPHEGDGASRQSRARPASSPPGLSIPAAGASWSAVSERASGAYDPFWGRGAVRVHRL
jgi:hypothetical protein